MLSVINQSRPSYAQGAFWILCLIALQILENIIPKLPMFPWLRLGTAYWLLVPIALYVGPKYALGIFMSRNILGFVYGITPLTTFFLSTSSGCLLWLVIAPILFWMVQKRILGLLGLCIAMALAFNIFQLYLAGTFLVRHVGFFFQLFPIVIWSLVSGALTALIVKYYGKQFMSHTLEESFFPIPQTLLIQNKTSVSMWIVWIVTFLIPVTLFLWMPSLAILFALVLLCMVLLGKKSLLMILPLWPLLGYFAWLHLFYTDGLYIGHLPITLGGLKAFSLASLRLLGLVVWGKLWLNFFGAKLQIALQQQKSSFALAWLVAPMLGGWTMGWLKSEGRQFLFRFQFTDAVESFFIHFKNQTLKVWSDNSLMQL